MVTRPATVGWRPGEHRPAFSPADLVVSAQRIREPVHIISRTSDGALGIGRGGALTTDGHVNGSEFPVVGTLPVLPPESLGDPTFCHAHGTRFAYIAGEMAGGIASARLVEAMARAGMLGFFGAAGLDLDTIDRTVAGFARRLGGVTNWGVNLIHNPANPRHEEHVVDLLLRHGVSRISASAYLTLTPAVVRCAASGLRTDPSGRIVRSVHLFAKVSRPEVAEQFLRPAPAAMVNALVAQGRLTETEAVLAVRVPVAEDVTVEADSGGHTDNRPLTTALPAIRARRDALVEQFGYLDPVRVGAAGGLGNPVGIAAAYALGAAYVLTGSVNQMAVEADQSEDAKALLAQAEETDVVMAPSADAFELGIKVQVLRRGTMFAARANRLYEAYRSYPSLESIPEEVRNRLEREIFRMSLEQAWELTRQFWQDRDPAQIQRAHAEPKHRMALVFRWYLGMSSRWAITGETERRADYQLWCGPAAGAFNRWTSGSFLADPANRTVTQIARNLLEGAAVATRVHQLRAFGVPVPTSAYGFAPRPLCWEAP
ncbi:2-nitropropane dioxygenase [Nocardia terpenica]|uniref:2-nitropropane dioxygenase n=2 Tax=Nocardia terpenica TaxID=455432 RepID=A0A161Z578_9NOCA|nr:2-nitropropane dioxygenase [Nocardia terpenica]NQE93402.1 PfaD family polyunsaturated fatty acid/polyketide biosynthesis protein [Nocardia terpenica]